MGIFGSDSAIVKGMFDGYSNATDAIQLIAGIMPMVFTFFLIVFVILGLVLAYHWRKYAYNIGAAFLFQIFYWGIGGLLIAGMGTALITFRG